MNTNASETTTNNDSELEGLDSLLTHAYAQLEAELLRKHEVGKDQYGEFAFLQAPTLEMAMDEVVDLINYMKFTYAKLFMLNFMTKRLQEQRQQSLQEGFIPTSQLFGT